MALDLTRHPCFDANARHEFGRIHLPVAPKCNVQCHFCDRRFDCSNESRPGVTSSVLAPRQAITYLKQVEERIPNLSVVGIAGPGDPFANPDETMETLRLVRDHDANKLLCVATNGLAIGPHIQELADLEVSHVTITINAVDPKIGQKVYAWMRDGTHVVRGAEAARLLLQRQFDAVRELTRLGVMVKVNSIIIPGVNEDHIPEIARVVSGLGASVLNAIPMVPVAGTVFEPLGSPPHERVAAIRAAAGAYLPQMGHCTRCRADAVGKLGEAMSHEIEACLRECASGGAKDRPYVAVASEEGMLVNLHLGEAEQFLIFDARGDLIETRPAPPSGGGNSRWLELAGVLTDCRAVLVNGVGEAPRKALADEGLMVHLTEGLIGDAVDAIFHDRSVPPPRRIYRCGEVCQGQGTGCG